MAGFDFGQIGTIIGGVMDTDEIDIGRSGLITLPDGSVTSIDSKEPYWRNIPCHLSYNQTDNPDPATAGAIPINVSLTINCGVSVDLQNADRIWARKLSATGEILERYEGTIGAPTTNQGRKEAIMAIRQGG